MRGLAAAFGVAALLATSGSAARPERSARVPVASHCTSGERIVYSCRFGAKLGSVCLGKTSLNYRFGKPGHTEIGLASTADWSNVHTGGNRNQGGLNQNSIRFTRGSTHYVVHAGETGSLNEHPGRRFSGIVVLESEREVANLTCKSGSLFHPEAFDAIGSTAPRGWDGTETPGGSFDMIY